MTDAEQREERERRREETQAVRRRETERPEGDQSSGAAETRRREAESDRQTRLACWRSGRRDTGEGKVEEEGVNEGEFECVRQTWTEAIVGSWS